MTETELTESEEELDLNTLSDEELVEQMHDCLLYTSDAADE